MLGDDNFDATVAGRLPVLVDLLGGRGCGRAGSWEPIVEELAADYAGGSGRKLNVDESPADRAAPRNRRSRP